jgi:hypothetical protein
MTTAKYTPGPWTVDYDPENGEDYAVFTSGTVSAEIAGRICIEANASLIARAPLMAEEIKRLRAALTEIADPLRLDDGLAEIFRNIARAALRGEEGAT